jgi:hypothetical protein
VRSACGLSRLHSRGLEPFRNVFAGDDVQAAKCYREARDFLLEFEPCVVHYEVVGEASGPGTMDR